MENFSMRSCFKFLLSRHKRQLPGAISLLLLTLYSPVAHAEENVKHSSAPHFTYVGTYTPNGEGVYRLQVDPVSGALSGKTLVSTLANPAQLVLDHQGKTLYVASEVANYNGGKHGTIVAYAVNPVDGGLKRPGFAGG